MTEVRVLNVFTDEHGRYGNPVGVVLDAAPWSQQARQRLAAHLGYSETVFVDDVEQARLQLFTPARELRFAGHPLVGVSALLAEVTGRRPDALRPARLAAPVPTFAEQETVWVRGSVDDAPPWLHEQFDEAAQIDALEAPGSAEPGQEERWRRTQCWAWLDESAAAVRARVFAADFGVVEDEACGSASLMLAAQLGRELTIRHGRGSVVKARPVPGDRALAEVGGLVADRGVRTVDLDRFAAPERTPA